jgi:hypothetical protein
VPAGSFDADLAAARDDLGRLVRRLRSLSPGGWKSRQAAAQAALAGFVALEVDLEGGPPFSPRVATHVLPDAIAVIGGDALTAIAVATDTRALVAAQGLIEAALASTR